TALRMPSRRVCASPRARARASSSPTVRARLAPAGSTRGSSGGRARRVCCKSLELRSEEHTSELQSRVDLVCRLLLEKKKIKDIFNTLKNLLSPFRKHPAKLGMVLLEVVAIALVCI